ncbi:MAG: transposase [Burkholderiales bacterium]|nr:transposase [Burkholderiales bacterium]
MSVSLVAREAGVSASLLFQWRKLDRQGSLVAVPASEALVPTSVAGRRPSRDCEVAACAG